MTFIADRNRQYLVDQLSNCHPRNPRNSMFIREAQNYLHHRPPKLQNTMREMQSMVIFIQKIILSIFDKEIFVIKDEFMKADSPLRFINIVGSEFE